MFCQVNTSWGKLINTVEQKFFDFNCTLCACCFLALTSKISGISGSFRVPTLINRRKNIMNWLHLIGVCWGISKDLVVVVLVVLRCYSPRFTLQDLCFKSCPESWCGAWYMPFELWTIFYEVFFWVFFLREYTDGVFSWCIDIVSCFL